MHKICLRDMAWVFIFVVFFAANQCLAQEGMWKLTDDELNRAPALSHEQRARHVLFKLELPKAKYTVGEVIWTKLTVTNLLNEYSVVMSPLSRDSKFVVLIATLSLSQNSDTKFVVLVFVVIGIGYMFVVFRVS